MDLIRTGVEEDWHGQAKAGYAEIAAVMSEVAKLPHHVTDNVARSLRYWQGFITGWRLGLDGKRVSPPGANTEIERGFLFGNQVGLEATRRSP